MAELEVIFDPIKEIATIVNIDGRCGWGPAMIGPEAGAVLQAFVDTTPFDVSLMGEYAATAAFAGFLEAMGGPPVDTPATPPVGPMEPGDGPSVAEGRAVDHEARDAGAAPPEPAPADSDEVAPSAVAVTIVDCFNCDGTGQIDLGYGTASQTCNMCQGKGKIAQAVAS